MARCTTPSSGKYRPGRAGALGNLQKRSRDDACCVPFSFGGWGVVGRRKRPSTSLRSRPHVPQPAQLRQRAYNNPLAPRDAAGLRSVRGTLQERPSHGAGAAKPRCPRWTTALEHRPEVVRGERRRSLNPKRAQPSAKRVTSDDRRATGSNSSAFGGTCAGRVNRSWGVNTRDGCCRPPALVSVFSKRRTRRKERSRQHRRRRAARRSFRGGGDKGARRRPRARNAADRASRFFAPSTGLDRARLRRGR